jgi:Zn-dependent peptidase ImmA (M78 family)
MAGWADGTVPVVVVIGAVSGDRLRFGLARELGGLLLDCDAVGESAKEKLAQRFAEALLVTASAARRELGRRRRRLDLRELAMLKRRHGLSMRGWIRRAADLGIIERSHARTLLAEMGSRGWRRREPVAFRGQDRPRKLRQLVVRALAEGVLTAGRAERICPGVTRDAAVEAPTGSRDARSITWLPKGERDRLMNRAAALVVPEYEDGGRLSGFESLSEEDHRDEPIEG